MAWNDEPTVRDLKPYADKHGFKAVVAVCFSGDGQFQVISFGQTKKLCDGAKILNNRLYNQLVTSELEAPDELL